MWSRFLWIVIIFLCSFSSTADRSKSEVMRTSNWTHQIPAMCFNTVLICLFLVIAEKASGLQNDIPYGGKFLQPRSGNLKMRNGTEASTLLRVVSAEPVQSHMHNLATSDDIPEDQEEVEQQLRNIAVRIAKGLEEVMLEPEENSPSFWQGEGNIMMIRWEQT